MAQWIVDAQLAPDQILSSSAARTQATAHAVASACGVDPSDIEIDQNLYLADEYTWRQAIAQRPAGRLLICGHNPGLDDLVETIADRPATRTASGKLMTTAAVAHFRLDNDRWSLETASAHLVQLVRPADLEDARAGS